jgi:hypothetical protein
MTELNKFNLREWLVPPVVLPVLIVVGVVVAAFLNHN